MNSLKLSVQNLSKSFADLKVLDNINLSIKNGEFVSIIGPSGCGKSTLFNIISGVEIQSKGEIFIDGVECKKRKGETGYMPQNPSLLPWATVEENITLGLQIKKQPVKIAKKRAEDLLKEFGLFEFAKNYPATLSGGMKQRVALLRTILFHDDFLLLDEPFGALDALTRTTLQIWLMRVWRKTKSSILFITHDISEAVLLSDRIYVMTQRPATIIKEVKVFLPRPRKLENLTRPNAVKIESQLIELLFNKNEIE